MKKLVALGGAAIAPLLLSAVIHAPNVLFIVSRVLNIGAASLGADEFKVIFGTILGGALGGGNLFMGILVLF